MYMSNSYIYKKLVLVPVACAVPAVHADCLLIAIARDVVSYNMKNLTTAPVAT